ncbi:APC family permease [Lebetimonas sp. JS032]|uniref:APC family permease n=1 Tax=Lebetimonas sp. JS032 TaxID=990070 RepID=UPI0004666719|nr:APC family permease [Lebetimonas sp. JS032]
MTKKALGFKELLAIGIGGMIGGGIFTILGISVSIAGFLAPFSIALGGVLAFFAGYAYVKLGVYYKDEGATYAFFKRTFANSHFAAAIIGWYTVFGYISTIALYAYTFSSYSISLMSFGENEIIRKIIAILIVWTFAAINLWSVRGMGEVEDVIVYLKLFILFIISFILFYFSKYDFHSFIRVLSSDFKNTPFLNILMVSSVTFVAYEGFQLIINGVKDMEEPDKNIPRAIYSAIFIVSMIYFIIALASVLSIDKNELIRNKEAALAVGMKSIVGEWGGALVIFSAILATTSAINSTLFGSSRQLARIADDGYMPKILSFRKGTIPSYSIVTMAFVASLLIIIGNLRLILEFGSITFLLVSFLMSLANFKIKDKTNSSLIVTLISMAGLFIGGVFIFYYEYKINKIELVFVFSLYVIIGILAFFYARKKVEKDKNS